MNATWPTGGAYARVQLRVAGDAQSALCYTVAYMTCRALLTLQGLRDRLAWRSVIDCQLI